MIRFRIETQVSYVTEAVPSVTKTWFHSLKFTYLNSKRIFLNNSKEIFRKRGQEERTLSCHHDYRHQNGQFVKTTTQPKLVSRLSTPSHQPHGFSGSSHFNSTTLPPSCITPCLCYCCSHPTRTVNLKQPSTTAYYSWPLDSL